MYIQPYQRGYHGFPGISWQVCFCYRWTAAWEMTEEMQSPFVGSEGLFTWPFLYILPAWAPLCHSSAICLLCYSTWVICPLPFLILFSLCNETVFISYGKSSSKSCKSRVWIRSSTPVKSPTASTSRTFQMDVYCLMSTWVAEMWKTNASVFLWFPVIEKQEAKTVFAHLCRLGSFNLLITPGSAVTG